MKEAVEDIKIPNKYMHEIEQARINYPLKKTFLVNPQIFMITDEFGNEHTDAVEFNTKWCKEFIDQVKQAWHEERQDKPLTLQTRKDRSNRIHPGPEDELP
jgi:hypothetical protein